MDVKKPNIKDYPNDIDGIAAYCDDVTKWIMANPDSNIIPTPWGDAEFVEDEEAEIHLREVEAASDP